MRWASARVLWWSSGYVVPRDIVVSGGLVHTAEEADLARRLDDGRDVGWLNAEGRRKPALARGRPVPMELFKRLLELNRWEVRLEGVFVCLPKGGVQGLLSGVLLLPRVATAGCSLHCFTVRALVNCGTGELRGERLLQVWELGNGVSLVDRDADPCDVLSWVMHDLRDVLAACDFGRAPDAVEGAIHVCGGGGGGGLWAAP